ncbi:VanZ family protein [Zoogloea sp.]|jgi:VanZ family protein|uniref:VanZ family protein n=1 Tax=Zoogloea sp. TaxID=49181 RepID=UPI0011D456CA|nr:VanZ family protein [Zoogloea sp.]TXG96696.1 MAG: VanZ family protein [Zoogloea sp.]HOY01371.1 VanZ family protein [Zoogloea sp.]HPI60370.1 VanZ family protein [Zoogloea sp.]
MPLQRRSSPLAAYFAAAIGVLIVYACLHPFSGWRDPGLPVFEFLSAPWPRYYTWVDLTVNVIGIVPFSFALVSALPGRLPRAGAVALAVLLTFLLSLSVETLQNFLPSRVPSNVDVGCNTLGGLLGAMAGGRWGGGLFDPHSGLTRWRRKNIVAGHPGEIGLTLMGLWLLTLLTPENLLFASGDLRRLFDLPTPLQFNPVRFVKVEAAIAASQLVAVGLTLRCMMRQFSPWPLVLLVVLGLGAKTLAAAAFFSPGNPFHWATPGGQIGLAAGTALLGLCLLLPARSHTMLAGLALLLGTALVNLAPDNPFLPSDATLIRQGNFLNFHGLTQLSASLWPFITFIYLGALGASSQRDGFRNH